MAHQRGHRNPGDLEIGATEVFRRHPTPHVAAQAEKPEWYLNWENRRPRWLMECMAECFGVLLYCYGGMGAGTAFFVTSAAEEEGFGSLLTVGFSYAFAIALAILIVGPTSGSHLNPCFSLTLALFKGFPWRKVPQYIISQILGGFIAGLVVYWQYKPALDEITAALTAAGLEQQIFTPTGPAFSIALFRPPGTGIGTVFVSEFVGSMVIAIVVFSVLDPSNIFVSPASAPFCIGLSYFVVIVCFAVNGVALNTARDLGGRLAAACIWGRGVFPAGYTAEAALTNILASIVGAAFQVFILSDSNRPHIHVPPTVETEDPSTRPVATGTPPHREKEGSESAHIERS